MSVDEFCELLQSNDESIQNGTEIELMYEGFGYEGYDQGRTEDSWKVWLANYDQLDKVLRAIASSRYLQTLKAFDFCSNDPIPQDSFEILCNRILSCHLAIREVSLDLIRLTPEQTSAVMRSVLMNKMIQDLAIPLTLAGAKGLADGVREGTVLQTISWLKGEDFSMDVCKHIASPLGSSTSLNILQINWINLVPDVATELGIGISKSTTLERLWLSNCEIDPMNASALGKGISESKTLREVSMTICSIGCEAAKALASHMTKSTTLQSIDLACNMIGGNGVLAIANIITNSKTFEVLDLNSNNIGDPGAISLAAAIKESSSLKIVRLDLNNIRDEGAVALADSIGTSKSLKEVAVAANKIGHDGARAFANAIGKSKSLEKVDVSRNDIGHAGIIEIANQTIRHNDSVRAINVMQLGADVDVVVSAFEEALRSSACSNFQLAHFLDHRQRSERDNIISVMKSNQRLGEYLERYLSNCADFPSSYWPAALERITEKPALLWKAVKTEQFFLALPGIPFQGLASAVLCAKNACVCPKEKALLARNFDALRSLGLLDSGSPSKKRLERCFTLLNSRFPFVNGSLLGVLVKLQRKAESLPLDDIVGFLKLDHRPLHSYSRQRFQALESRVGESMPEEMAESQSVHMLLSACKIILSHISGVNISTEYRQLIREYEALSLVLGLYSLTYCSPIQDTILQNGVDDSSDQSSNNETATQSEHVPELE